MYEQFRTKFSQALNDKPLTEEAIIATLDLISKDYNISPKELEPSDANSLPEGVQNYLTCKKMQGLAETTLANYNLILSIFFTEVRKDITKITTNDIRTFLYNYQLKKKVSRRTLDKYREYISRFFSWAHKEGLLTANPAANLYPIKYEHKQLLWND